MKFDKRMTLTKEELVSDGMGGFEVIGKVQVGTIQAFISPVTAELLLKEYGVVSTTALKIFTQNVIDEENFQIEYADKKFEILQKADYGKYKMFLVQEITPNE